MFHPTLATYIILFAVVFGINVIPLFMPPTWSILAFFYIRYGLFFPPTIIIGATAAVLGRIVLATFARSFGHLLPKKTLENIHALGSYAKEHTTISVPALVVYAFLPIPSNQAFIAAGLSEINISWFAFSFFIGRLISYTFWVGAAHRLSGSLDAIFNHHFSRPSTFLFDITGFLCVILISIIPWKRILPSHKKS